MSRKEKQNNKKMSAGAWIKEMLIILICAIALAVVVKGFLVDSRAIPSSSMVPTIEIGDRVVLWKLAYVFGDPERGDIVVFDAPAELHENDDLIKRVIGLPGDTVEIADGFVYINGEALEENYLAERPDYEYGPVTVPDDCYFMMGDNRNNSIDSHEWSNPFLPEDNIKGKAIFRYWPVSRIGGIYGNLYGDDNGQLSE